MMNDDGEGLIFRDLYTVHSIELAFGHVLNFDVDAKIFGMLRL
jgi:hypothetical protein